MLSERFCQRPETIVLEMVNQASQDAFIPAETAGLVKDERSLPAKPAIKGFLRSGGPVQKQPAPRALQSHIGTSRLQTSFANGNRCKTLDGRLANSAGSGKYECEQGIPNYPRSLKSRR